VEQIKLNGLMIKSKHAFDNVNDRFREPPNLALITFPFCNVFPYPVNL
jgi:hypothetical protein